MRLVREPISCANWAGQPADVGSVVFDLGVSSIRESFFKDGNPADNHDNCATDKSCEEKDFDETHRQDHQREVN